MRNFKVIGVLVLAMVMLFTMTACGASNESTTEVANETTAAGETQATTEAGLSGEILIDGSSTVFPITEAMAEEFGIANPDVRVTVGVSGTGGGFKKFAVGETDISNASRPIKDSEAEIAKTNGIEYLELAVAFDGLTVVVNKDNTWAETMTVEQLTALWAPESTVQNWSDIDPTWPNEKIVLYAPGVDSGTFDYFTETINGESGAIRQDFTPSEDDNVLVQGVAGDKYAMAFFGFSYYEENMDTLKAVQIDNGNGPIMPTYENINTGTYAPLSRPLFIYVSTAALEKPEVKAFVQYYIENAMEFVPQVGYIALPEADYAADLEKIK